LTHQNWLERMAIERLESKYNYLNALLSKTKNHWEKVLLVSLGKAFGMKVNAQAFEQLLRQVEFSLLLKYQHEPQKLEAWLFGIARPLSIEQIDPYTSSLVNELEYLQKIHKLSTLRATEWKFHRMRPYNFPIFRLAQLAALYTHDV